MHPVIRRVTYKVMQVIVVLLFFFFLSEIYYRVTENNPNPSALLLKKSDNPILVYTNNPSYISGKHFLDKGKVTYDINSSDYISINSKGLRDYYHNYQKNKSVLRILAVGDSVTFGSGVKMEETWPKQLETMLNVGSVDKYEVLNFGVRGYGLSQNYELLITEGMKYDPDMIIIGYFLNDPHVQEISPFTELLSFSELRQREDLMIEKYGLGMRCKFRNNLAKFRILTKSPIITFITKDYVRRKWFYNDLVFKVPVSMHNDPCSWNRVSFIFNLLHDLSQEENISIVIVIFPMLSEFNSYPLASVHQQVVLEAEKNYFLTIDILETYKAYNYERLLLEKDPDPIHPNAFGHKLIASSITKVIDTE